MSGSSGNGTNVITILKPYDIEQLFLQIKRAIEKQKEAALLHQRNKELLSTNAELNILHNISQVINQTLDMNELLSGVLGILEKSEIFTFETRASFIFLQKYFTVFEHDH